MFGASWDWREYGLVLRANAGSAFRSPSIFELFLDAPYGKGNLKLDPESSFTWELGIEKYASAGKLNFSVSTWHTKIEDAIIWQTDPLTYTGTYVNADQAVSHGVEVGFGLKPSRYFKSNLNYTYTDSRKKSSGLSSRNIQVPYNKINLNGTFLFLSCSLSLDGAWVDSSRLRWNGIDLADGYFLLGCSGRFPAGDNVTVTVRAQNLLDQDYVEVIGYREPGVTVFGGIEMRY